MKKFLEKLLLMLLAILLSSPVAAIFIIMVDILMVERDPYEGELDFWGEVYFLSTFSIPVYIILGIPVTLIIDALNSNTKVPFGFKSYLIQLLLYTLSAIAVNLLVPSYSRNVVSFITFSIPVYTYFHVLFYLRKRKAVKFLRI
ncbi:hypothetical protein [Cytobacillus pseudoceanisediminis]|uniref:hypothetical protein n=1 Tax=Cytobacillus pseudoceanisediminis TaxID=3051614 RepID=UPI003CF75085